MIRISKEMMMNAVSGRKEPPEDVVKTETEKLLKHFSESFGWSLTDLAEQTIPVIARRSCDFRRGEKDWNDAHKGVALLGNVGTGKTILLSYVALLIDVAVFNVPELSRVYAVSGAEAFWNRVMDRTNVGQDMVLDDLGAETESKYFGAPFPIVDLLYRRYDLWKSSGHRLWVSSNLTGQELSARYGERVSDRLREMTVVVPATGKSLRK